MVWPICARKSLGQWGQGMVAAVAVLAVLFFLVRLRSSATAVLFASHVLPPLWTTDRQDPLLCAEWSHVLWLMLNAFRQRGFKRVIETLLLSTVAEALSLLKLAKQHLLWESFIRHASYVSFHAKLGLHKARFWR